MSVGAELLVENEPTVDSVELAPKEVTARSPWQLFWRRFRQDRVAMVSAIFIIFLIIIAIFAPLVVKLDAFGSPTGPSSAHPFGVDELGRDVLSRTIYGARVSLIVGIFGTALATVLGTFMGLIAGYYRGWADTLISRIVDVFLAFPQLGLGTVIFIILIASFTYIARIARGQVLSLREKEFVEASRSLGASNSRILFREILPNLMAPLIVYSSLLIPVNILFEAALSFLGVGIRPPSASWGEMIAYASPIFNTAWWYMLFPGIALLLTVLAFNLVGDGLLDALNPRGDTR